MNEEKTIHKFLNKEKDKKIYDNVVWQIYNRWFLKVLYH